MVASLVRMILFTTYFISPQLHNLSNLIRSLLLKVSYCFVLRIYYFAGESIKRNNLTFISQSQFILLNNQGLVINGLNGGLLLGNSHSENGIKLIRVSGKGYKFIAEAEGWEYLVNSKASQFHKNELEEINRFYQDEIDFNYYEPISSTSIIDARFPVAKFQSKIVLVSEYQFFIVNKFATRMYLERLNEINLII